MRLTVSVVDGFNLPMTVDNNQGCGVPSCPVDLNPNCPAALAGPKDSSGKVVGCKSACVAGLGDPANSPNCCTGSHNTAKTCPPSGVQNYSYFSASPPLPSSSHKVRSADDVSAFTEKSCKNSYAYAYDESSGTALWTCDSKLRSDYTITFCP